jgi:hypothetical protein
MQTHTQKSHYNRYLKQKAVQSIMGATDRRAERETLDLFVFISFSGA